MEEKGFQIHRVNTLPTTGNNGDWYILKKGTDRHEVYIVQPNGTLTFSKGITDDEANRLDQLNQTQITKLSSLNTQQQLDTKFQDQKDYTDSKVFQTVSETIPIESTVLPKGSSIPSWITTNGKGLLTGGIGGTTYTQTGGSPITVAEGFQVWGFYDKALDIWTFGSPFPLNKNIISNFVVGETYPSFAVVMYNGVLYRNESGTSTSVTPSLTSLNWKPIDKIITITPTDIDTAININYLYLVVGGLTPYLLQPHRNGTFIRQSRQLLVASSGDTLPVFQYRDSNDTGTTWGSWNVRVGYQTLLDGFASSRDAVTTAGVWKLADQIMPVGVNSATSNPRQVRMLFNYTSKPRFVYRDQIAGVWSTEQDLYNDWGFDGILTATQANTYTISGNYIVSGTNPFILNVSKAGTQIRHIKTVPNLTGEPLQQYQDSLDNGVTWSGFKTYGLSNRMFKVLSTSEDMMWSWWNYPVILRSDDRMDKVFISYTDSMGETGVYSQSLKTGSRIKAPVKTTILDIDDHNAGAVIKLADSTIFTGFPSGHAKTGRFFTAKSEKKDDASRWIDTGNQNMRGAISYIQLLNINGVLYLFTRRTATAYFAWTMSVSTDNGVTWSTDKDVLNTPNTLQWYALFRPVSDNPDLIRILHCSHPTQSENDIRGGFIKISTGEVLDVDATTVKGTLGTDNNALSFSIIVNKGSSILRLLDTVPTPTNQWKILYVKFTNANDGIYFSYETGTTYQLTEAGQSFLPASFYYGGAVYGEDGDIYLSKRTSTESIIEKWSRNIQYSKVLEIDRDNKLLIRPIYDKGVLAYLYGYYNPLDYRDFEMEAIIKKL